MSGVQMNPDIEHPVFRFPLNTPHLVFAVPETRHKPLLFIFRDHIPAPRPESPAKHQHRERIDSLQSSAPVNVTGSGRMMPPRTDSQSGSSNVAAQIPPNDKALYHDSTVDIF